MEKIIATLVALVFALGAFAQCDFSYTHGVLKPQQYWKYKDPEQNRSLLRDWVNGNTNLDLNLGSLDFLQATQAVWSDMGHLSISQLQEMYSSISDEMIDEEGRLYFAYISPNQYDLVKNQGKCVYSTNGSGGWKIQSGLRTLTVCDYNEIIGDNILVIMINYNGSRYIAWMAQCWNPCFVFLTKIKSAPPKKECCGNTYITNNYYYGGERSVVVYPPIQQVTPVYIQSLPLCNWWMPNYVYTQTSFGFYVIWDTQAGCHRKIRCGNHQGQQQCNYTPNNPIPPDEPGQGPNGDGVVYSSDGPEEGTPRFPQNGQKQVYRQYQPAVANTAIGGGGIRGGYTGRPSPSMSGTSNYQQSGGGSIKIPTSRPSNGARPAGTISPSMPANTGRPLNGSR